MSLNPCFSGIGFGAIKAKPIHISFMVLILVLVELVSESVFYNTLFMSALLLLFCEID